MKTISNRSLVGILILSLLFLPACSQKVQEKPLQTAKVGRGDILAELSTTGGVIPRNRLEIKPPVAGRIEQVLVAEGQSVSKGQVLAWMSSSERAAILDAARAKGTDELQYWQDVYKPAPIMAPLAGFVIKRDMEQGQYFGTSDTVLVLADRLIVQAQVDETDIGQIKLGQRADIALDAYPDRQVPGTVEHIAYESDTINNVTVYNVDVLPRTVPDYFRSGMSASVNFLLREKKDVLTLPLTAVKRRNGRSFVFQKEGEKYKAVPVETGLENTNNIELVSGLGEGDEVVIPTQRIVQQTLDQNQFRGPLNFLGPRR